MDLIIVESPTKARTFHKYLDANQYRIIATMGHIRDLPEDRLAVEIENNFKPLYVVTEKKKAVVEQIKTAAKGADGIILATDADREGEAISYHVAYLLGKVKEDWPKSLLIENNNLKRIIFHEITKEALEEALNQPRSIDLNLVNSQHARRLLDRLVGYQLSPLLWKKVGKKWLSAGRVQTVALRFIVEREKEISRFASETFYRVIGKFLNKDEIIEAKLISKDGVNYEKTYEIKLFDGKYQYTKTNIKKEDLNFLEKEIKEDNYTVS